MIVTLRNIQTIKEAVYDFPDTGLVQILGHNSNGKSIVIKAVEAVAKLTIKDKEERLPLIRDGEDRGMIAIQYKEKLLTAILDRDSSKCVLVLQRDLSDSDSRIYRYFREGGLEELVSEFGFCVYGGGAICLQISEQFGIIPFVNATASMNGEAIEAITTDTVAQQFITSFKEITHKRAKEYIIQFNDRIKTYEDAIARLPKFDYEAYESLYAEMQEIYEVVSVVKPVTLINLEPPRAIDIIRFKAPELERLSKVQTLPLIGPMEHLTEVMKVWDSYRKGVCPTCKRRLIGGVTNG